MLSMVLFYFAPFLSSPFHLKLSTEFTKHLVLCSQFILSIFFSHNKAMSKQFFSFPSSFSFKKGRNDTDDHPSTKTNPSSDVKGLSLDGAAPYNIPLPKSLSAVNSTHTSFLSLPVKPLPPGIQLSSNLSFPQHPNGKKDDSCSQSLSSNVSFKTAHSPNDEFSHASPIPSFSQILPPNFCLDEIGVDDFDSKDNNHTPLFTQAVEEINNASYSSDVKLVDKSNIQSISTPKDLQSLTPIKKDEMKVSSSITNALVDKSIINQSSATDLSTKNNDIYVSIPSFHSST